MHHVREGQKINCSPSSSLPSSLSLLQRLLILAIIYRILTTMFRGGDDVYLFHRLGESCERKSSMGHCKSRHDLVNMIGKEYEDF